MLWRSWHVILVYSEWKPYTRRHQSARRSDELSRPGWMVGYRFGYPEDVLLFSMMIIHIDQWTVLYHNSMYSIYAIDSNKRFLISLLPEHVVVNCPDICERGNFETFIKPIIEIDVWFAIRCIKHHINIYPDSEVHGTNMGSIWVWQDPDRPHVGHRNLTI